jgi:hypothetical protein
MKPTTPMRVRAFRFLTDRYAHRERPQLLSGMAKSANCPVVVRVNRSELMRKMRRIFLIGVLCGVMITAAVTFGFAIPANSDQWRWEIWKRGGAAWTFDKKGHLSWRWTVEPISDTQPKKPVIKRRNELEVTRLLTL